MIKENKYYEMLLICTYGREAILKADDKYLFADKCSDII